jgi:hypothetical protein
MAVVQGEKGGGEGVKGREGRYVGLYEGSTEKDGA